MTAARAEAACNVKASIMYVCMLWKFMMAPAPRIAMPYDTIERLMNEVR